MDLIRSGGTLTESSYDPSADMAAHSSSLRRPVKETETYLNKTQLEALRKVQNERLEIGKRKVGRTSPSGPRKGASELTARAFTRRSAWRSGRAWVSGWMVRVSLVLSYA